MSGQKISYVQITDYEYDRMMEATYEVENIESRVQYQLERQEHQLRSDFNNQMSQIKQKSKKQEANIKRLDNKIDNLIVSIEAKEANKKSQALSWLSEAEDALSAIDSFRHEKFCPNEYAKLQQSYELSKTNIENEVYEASISGSQKLWQEACELKAKLEVLENEWNEYFEQAVESNLKLIATCDAQTTLELAFDIEDGSEELEVDIDYWCDGQLTQLKELALSQENLLTHSEVMDIDEFKKLIKESSRFQHDAEALTQKAKEAIILSQLRSDMASDIVDSLDDAGFELEDSCFKGDDKRSSVHLKMTNISGDEIVTIITPVNNRENKLDIHFFDKNSDENFKQTRLQSMMQRLNESGVECQTPQCAEGTEHNGSGNESVRDFEKVKSLQRG
jgi:hypothetical protein